MQPFTDLLRHLPWKSFWICSSFLPVGFILAGCGPRDAAFNPSHFHARGIVVPPNVVVPANVRPGTNYAGLYTAKPSGIICCLVAPHARLLIRKSRDARTLHVFSYVPDWPPMRSGEQAITVTFDKTGDRETFPSLKEGFHESIVAVPRTFRALRGVVGVTLDSKLSFRAGSGPRAPVYAYVLTSIYFE